MEKQLLKRLLKISTVIILGFLFVGYTKYVKVDTPVVITDDGFYGDSFEILFAESSNPIYYTLDGTIPNKNSELYKGAIPIDDDYLRENNYCNYTNISATKYYEPDYIIPKTIVVKAVCINSFGKRGKVVTKNFFNKATELFYKDNDIFVACLDMDPNHLFDDKNGIYVLGDVYNRYVQMGGDVNNIERYEIPANYKLRDNGEVSAHFYLLDYNRNVLINDDIGIRIRGNVSRIYPKKSFNLSLQKLSEGVHQNEYEIISRDLALRSGGNDHHLMMNDYMSYEFAKKLNITSSRLYPCALFMNGEFWGMYLLNNNYDKEYLAKKYDLFSDNIVISNDRAETLEVKPTIEKASTEKYFAFPLEHDMSLDENYKIFCDMVDIKSLCDYYAFNIFLNNYDWPKHNYSMWRTRNMQVDSEYGDNRWRYLLTDCNFNSCFDVETAEADIVNDMEDSFFDSLMQNDMFRSTFINELLYITYVVFSDENLDDTYEKLISDGYSDALYESIRRYGGNPSELTYYFEENLKPFIEKRRIYIMDAIERILCKYSESSNRIKDIVVVSEVPIKEGVILGGNTIDLTYCSWYGKVYLGSSIEFSLSSGVSDNIVECNKVASQSGNVLLKSDADSFFISIKCRR